MLPKKLVIILVAVVAALILLALFVGAWVFGLAKADPAGPSEYSAVYMSTGDIYYGKLSWFPSLHLTKVWFLQRTGAAVGQPQLGILPFGSAFWGPTDEVYLNPKQIIFLARLRNDSQVTQAFNNPAAFGQQAQPQQVPANAFQGPSGPPPATQPVPPVQQKK